MQNFNEQLSRSTQAFNSLCVPILKSIMDYQFMSIEGFSADEHKRLLDISAGIDIWAYNNRGVRGIASRIQWGKLYKTFTVRAKRQSGAKTEFEKRTEAIKNDYLYPYYTMQAYIDEEKILGLAICRTVSLYEKIQNGDCQKNHTGMNQIGQASFYVIPWDSFDKGDIRVYAN